MEKLSSFKQLLLRKSNDDSTSYLVKILEDEKFLGLVYESLKKMADSKNKGKNINQAFFDWTQGIDPNKEPEMIHDALSHHASRYKAAIAQNNQKLANQHAAQLFKIMDLSKRAERHANGGLTIEAPSVHPWEKHSKPETFGERMAEFQQREKEGNLSAKDKEWMVDNQFVRGKKPANAPVSDTKGWNYRGADFSFLRHAPHPKSEEETAKTGHTGAFPMENIKVNGKYLDIKDIDPKELKGFESHSFDHHPILRHFERKQSDDTDKKTSDFHGELDAYDNSPHIEKYYQKLGELESSDPTAFASRGLNRSDSVHGEPLDSSIHAVPNNSTSEKRKNNNTNPSISPDVVESHLASLPPEIAAHIRSKMGNSAPAANQPTPTKDVSSHLAGLPPEMAQRLATKMNITKPVVTPPATTQPTPVQPKDVGSHLANLPPEMAARLKAKMGQ